MKIRYTIKEYEYVIANHTGEIKNQKYLMPIVLVNLLNCEDIDEAKTYLLEIAKEYGESNYKPSLHGIRGSLNDLAHHLERTEEHQEIIELVKNDSPFMYEFESIYNQYFSEGDILENYYTLDITAKKLKRSIRQVRNYINNDQLDYTRDKVGKIMVSELAIRKFLNNS